MPCSHGKVSSTISRASAEVKSQVRTRPRIVILSLSILGPSLLAEELVRMSENTGEAREWKQNCTLFQPAHFLLEFSISFSLPRESDT